MNGRTAKTAQNENFPVASLILARENRAPVLAFYRFVREADDIADAADLFSDEKLRRLAACERRLEKGAVPFGAEQARLMLKAFRHDVSHRRFESWRELTDYCASSANPVGRFLLSLHAELPATYAPSDALCTALQILNHLQDMGNDRIELDRVYIPGSWLAEVGGEDAFFSLPNTRDRRSVIDAVLDRVDLLIDEGRILPHRVRDRRLRAQARATVALASRLSARLRVTDPLCARVETSKVDAVHAFLRGLRGLATLPAADAKTVRVAVRRSRSSFGAGMKSLSSERQRGIHAVYAFCRIADDIADGAMPPDEKTGLLNEWRRELDRIGHGPQTPVGREVAWATAAFELPVQEFHNLLDGMEMDCARRVRIADDDALHQYTRRVAGSVGILSLHVFGTRQVEGFGVELGHTLQLVNILRDIDEDAARDRVYLPLSRLAARDAAADTIIRDARFARECERLAQEARAGFAVADAALGSLDQRALRPAILMMEGYRRILEKLERRGWGPGQGRLRLNAADRLQLLSFAMRTFATGAA
jgi:phytoene synthase